MILVVEKNLENKTGDCLFREARRKGDFDVDYHFLVHRDGTIEEGRNVDAIGSFEINEEEDAVIIFVDLMQGKETDYQKDVLAELAADLQKKYPGAVIYKIVE